MHIRFETASFSIWLLSQPVTGSVCVTKVLASQIKMKLLCIFAALLFAVTAQSYPEWYMQNLRYRRDVSLDRKVGDNGRVFGTLGSNDNGLFGRGGYEHKIFDDQRGKLDAQVHGTRVLGPYGDSSHLGGSLNWQNSNAAASLEASRQIHGPSSQIKMKLLCIFAALLFAVTAQSYPEWYMQNLRYRRDVSLDRKVGDNGRVFGTLGSNDNGLFGRGGYEHKIFDDQRGKLDAQVHGTRVLGPYGDSSHLGGSLNWQNSNAAASLEASRQIHGPSSINAAAGGRWPVGNGGDLSAQGFYSQTSGMGRDYGGRLNLRYPW